MTLWRRWLLVVLLPWAMAVHAQAPSYGGELEGFDYPAPVQKFAFKSQQLAMHMAYLDIQPSKPNGHVAVLLHGKNFAQRLGNPPMRYCNSMVFVSSFLIKLVFASPANQLLTSTVSSNWRTTPMPC